MERFVFHAAGLDGLGGSSYIDSVVYRDRDMMASSTPKAFREAGDGTLEERRYFCQNWRADVSAVVDEAGNQLESVKYFSYGMPFCLPAGDMDSDGDYDQTDENVISGWSTGYDVRADANLDGYIDSSDTAVLVGHKGSSALGRGFLSRSDVQNRKGYAGYENDGVLGDGALTNSNSRFWHVRHRVLDSTTGMWTSRDPMGYISGKNLTEYVFASPIANLDPMGLFSFGNTPGGVFTPEPEYNRPTIKPTIYCVGTACQAPEEDPIWPTIFSIIVTFIGPDQIVPSDAIEIGLELIKIKIARLKLEYEADRPASWIDTQDARYLILYGAWQVVNHRAKFRRSVCQDLGPDQFGPPSPNRGTTVCPDSYTDGECCGLISAWGTGYPSNPTDCGLPGITCTPRPWAPPVPPHHWPGRLP